VVEAMAMDRAEMQRRAISKAQRLGGPAKVVRLQHGVYKVPSSSEGGVWHVVTGTAFDGSDHLCTCPAGELGRPCWHSAAVRLRRIQESWLAWDRRRRERLARQEAPQPFLLAQAA
jgi:SWIM zinc finger